MGVGSVRTAVSESDEAKDNEVRRREFELVDDGGGFFLAPCSARNKLMLTWPRSEVCWVPRSLL
jgi:hypothetical protein